MNVFATIDEWPLAPLVDWIAGDGGESPADLVKELLPEPEDHNFEDRRPLREAWASRAGLMKTVAYLWLAELHEWNDGELREHPTWETFTRA